MSRIVRAEVSAAALAHNYQQAKTMTNHRQILAMVKANGYGHGLIQVAQALSNADAFGVARLDEGVILADAGIKTPIVLMEGCFSKEELETAISYHFPIVLHSPYQVSDLLSLKSFDMPCKVWLKLNTGMNRLGFSEKTFQLALETLSQQKNIQILGYMTHFSQADDSKHHFTHEQNDRFLQIVGNLPGFKSAANSAAILAWPETHHDWVRPGLMLYGAAPFADKTAQDFNLKPVMRLTTEVIAIHDLAPNEAVGYGATYRSAQPSRIAIAAIGYGDGYPWAATNNTPVWVGGHLTHLAGRVSMDMIAIDITNLPDIALGAEVELWGPNLPIEQVAASSQTLPYELFTRLTSRVNITMI